MPQPVTSKTMFTEEVEKFITFYKNNLWAMAIGLFVIVLSYGFKLFNYSISIDSEVAILNNNISAWARDGRFGIYIIKHLMGGQTLSPYIANLLSIVMVFVNALLWNYVIYSATKGKNNGKLTSIVFISILISYPSSTEYMNFLTYSFEVTVGHIFCALAVLFISKWILNKESRVCLFTGMFFMVFSFSIYQALFSVYMVGVCAYMILHCLYLRDHNIELTNNELIQIFKKYLLTFLSGVAIYTVLNKLVILIMGKNQYLENFIGWGNINTQTLIHNVVKYIGDILIAKHVYYGKLFPIMILLFIGIAIFEMLHQKKNKKSMIFFSSSLVLIPCLLTIILGTAVPIRGQLTLPLITAFGGFLMLYLCQNRTKTRNYLCVALLLVALYQGQAMARIFYGEYMKYQMDVALASKISMRIDMLDLGEMPNKPVVYIGNHRPNYREEVVLRKECIGYSFFEWETAPRMELFMDTLGYIYKRPTQEQRELGKVYAKDMPVWPHNGAVAVKEDMIIVNFPDKR